MLGQFANVDFVIHTWDGNLQQLQVEICTQKNFGEFPEDQLGLSSKWKLTMKLMKHHKQKRMKSGLSIKTFFLSDSINSQYTN